MYQQRSIEEMAWLSVQQRAEEMNQSRETGVQSSFSSAAAFSNHQKLESLDCTQFPEPRNFP